jgi:hypothetical protein
MKKIGDACTPAGEGSNGVRKSRRVVTSIGPGVDAPDHCANFVQPTASFVQLSSAPLLPLLPFDS